MSSGETLESSAARVRALRLANGLTQEELAHRLGVSFVSVNRWENERTRPAASVWRKLVDLQPSVALSPLADEPLGLFIGRSAELNMLESLVATHRLVTLTGPGGCGKTRLALELSRRARQGSSAWRFVDLSTATDGPAAEAAIQRALGLRDSPGRSVEETILAHLRAAPAFLVLDNCEQVIDPVAELIARILGSCPSVAIVATSREVLRVAGELAWRVPPMGLPMVPGLDAANKSDAVRLFVDRARLRAPGFRLTAESAAIVAAICQSLDALPLAIELAASQAASVPLEALAARPAHAVERSTADTRGGPVRHRSLRHALDWSFDLLGEDERAVLLPLAVFAGGFELDAAEAVCDSPAVAPIVQALVEKSLVVFENGRYRMLETVRAYALRRLQDAGGAADASLRHARFFLSLGPAGPSAIAASEARIHRERDNHGAAMAFWRDRGCSEELGQMVSNAVRVWMYYGQLREGLSWINTMLAAELPPASRSNWLRAAAGLASAAMETAAASRYFSELLDLARGRSDDSGISHALLGLGALAMWKGDAHAAVEAISEAVAIPERAGDRAAATHLRHYLGSALIGLGDFESARRELLLTLAGARAEGLLEAEAWATLYLGDLAWMRGDFVAAEAHTLDSLGLFTRLGQSYSQSVARGRLALLRSRAGDETGACQLLIASYDASTPLGLAFAALVQSMVLARRRPATAAALFGAIRSIAELTGIVVPAPWREAHDDALAATSEALGESTFNTACERGAFLPLVNVCEAGLHDAQELLRELESASAVSAREAEVLARVAAGATNKEIALDLGISVRTAERHLANSYAKIGARGRADAIAWILREKGTSVIRP